MDKWEAVLFPHQIIGFTPVPGLVPSCKFASNRGFFTKISLSLCFIIPGPEELQPFLNG